MAASAPRIFHRSSSVPLTHDSVNHNDTATLVATHEVTAQQDGVVPAVKTHEVKTQTATSHEAAGQKLTAINSSAESGQTMEQSVVYALDRYFADLDGAKPHALYEMVMIAVERPLLKYALNKSQGNQSAAADLLGINRNTLRKKLIEHGLAK